MPTRASAPFSAYTPTAGLNILEQDPEKLRAYDVARDALGLRVESEEGIPLPVSWVHIADYFEEIGDYQAMVNTENIRAFPQFSEVVGSNWNSGNRILRQAW
jgi:hypothetical protein